MVNLIINYANLIAKERDIHSLIETIARFGRDLTEADRCSIWLVDKNKDKLWTIVAQELDSKITIPIDKGIVGHSIKENKDILVNNTEECEHFYCEVDKATGYKTKSVISIPISNKRGEVVGAIQVVNKKSDTKEFTTEDLEYLKIAGSYIGDTLESLFLKKELKDMNKKLSKQIETKREELSRLNSVLEEKLHDEVVKSQIKDKELLSKAKQAQMGEMISVIAHQWKQPLSTIYAISSASLYSMDNKKFTEQRAKENFKDIDSTIHFLAETIDEFRNFFNPQKEQNRFYVSEIIDKVEEIIRGSYIGANIKLEQNIDDIEIQNYKNEIIHVLLNICNNAKDAIVENSIQNPKVSIDVTHDKDILKIEISDNGGGIDSSVIDKIFEPYVSTKSESSGTGLGLYLCKKIIDDKCAGKLYAKNSDIGAIFVVELPIS
jgi:signal transduction histidine kinase